MKLPRQPAAVVFDMDGLLFDTESIYERAALLAAAELGQEMDSTFFRSTVGFPWLVTRERLIERYGPTFAVDELRSVARRIFGEMVDRDLPLKPGVAELLGLLDELDLPRAIATTCSSTACGSGPRCSVRSASRCSGSTATTASETPTTSSSITWRRMDLAGGFTTSLPTTIAIGTSPTPIPS